MQAAPPSDAERDRQAHASALLIRQRRDAAGDCTNGFQGGSKAADDPDGHQMEGNLRGGIDWSEFLPQDDQATDTQQGETAGTGEVTEFFCIADGCEALLNEEGHYCGQ